jgi:molybdenum cofactor cytidylyltransferase
MTTPSHRAGTRIAAILLAAGESRRFGAPKLLARWQGRPLLRHAALTALAAPVHEIIVVLGAFSARVAPALHGLPLTWTVNRRWQEGMSSSVRAGLRALRQEVDGVIFLLADQPRVTPELLTTLIQRHHDTGAPIVAPRFAGRQGNPVLFARTYFPELMAVQGDQGGREVIRRHADAVVWLDLDPAIALDIDTPADLSAHAKASRGERRA